MIFYFEIDFLLTSDKYVFCSHDWNNNFSKNIKKKITEPPSLQEFNNLVINNGNYTNCTLDGLVGFLDNNRNIKIVTDSKDDNLLILRKISEKPQIILTGLSLKFTTQIILKK